MKVIICGPRGLWLEPEVIEDAVHLSGFSLKSLICGMADGVDKSAFDWAYQWCVPQIPIIEKPYKRQFKELGGFIRNQEMVDIADAWIGITDELPLTKGTIDCYIRAKKAKIPTYIHNLSGLLI